MKPKVTGLAVAPNDLPGRDRKAEHIRLALEERMQLERNFFEEYAFEHQALPEIDFDEIETTTSFLGRPLAAPLLISCMTGGTDDARRINRNLAQGAQEVGIAVGVGSQRKALEDESKAESFRIRPLAPTVPLLANLGAVQLNYGYGLDACRRAVEQIEADALVLHLNALQEAIQPEGQRNFKGLLPKIARVVRELGVPVIVKEVGCGLSAATGRALLEAGVTIVDTAGLGGTNWARIEAARANDVELGERFAGWGIPTPESIAELRGVPGLTVIGSGGVRDGIDVAKALALGADLAGMAYPFLQAANRSAADVAAKIRRTIQELKICMFCAGARTTAELRQAPLRRRRVEGPR
ncbi:MAG TPA: type 2 isopentenyl-diphosphate Delta-isomerase [Candidatus Polarisedimenticolaceae bacterium]|nr:type 2 isopentenyl-diphosphate Delta-isomerase [Candidatus Polarisedimenticolaceae bacterium]